jgi:hypothetical protein
MEIPARPPTSLAFKRLSLRGDGIAQGADQDWQRRGPPKRVTFVSLRALRTSVGNSDPLIGPPKVAAERLAQPAGCATEPRYFATVAGLLGWLAAHAAYAFRPRRAAGERN